jgi:flavin-binding protein dodecin
MISWNNLDNIDWPATQATAYWVKTLNELLMLTTDANTPEKCNTLADVLDQFADSSNGDDLATITNLDKVARKTARSLRMADITQRLQALEAASSDYRAAVKLLDAATSGLQKETRLLQAEKINAAVTALTGTILTLNTLTQSMTTKDDATLMNAINQAAQSMKNLRNILEVPA